MDLHAPVVRKDDYVFMLRSTLSSARDIIQTVGLYPDFPPSTNLLRDIELSLRRAHERRFEEVRAVLNGTIRVHSGLFNFDSGDSVSRGLLKSALSLLRISSQNILDNCLKLSSSKNNRTSIREPNSRSSIPAPARMFCRDREVGNRQPTGLFGARGAHTLDSTPSHPPAPRKTFSWSSTGNISCPDQSPPKSVQPERKTRPVTRSRKTPSPSPSPPFEEWTAEDAANFDYDCYYGSSSWHLE